jgi:monoamine oxidase
MRRSEFIKLLGLGGAGLLMMGSGHHRKRSGATKRVIIVGAGIAGIAAARVLKEAGHEVVIIEARDRIGGRIWTDYSLGTPIDMGASWIHHSKTNPLTEIVAQHRLGVKTTDYANYYLFDADGRPLPETDRESHFATAEKVLKKANKVWSKADIGMNMRQAVDEIVQAEKLEDPIRQALEWRISMLELYKGAELNLVAAAGETEGAMAFNTDDLLVTAGFGKIIEKLAAGLDIRMNQKVLIVRQNDERATVTTAGEDFEGDFALITLPLGVLKAGDVRFDPVFSTSKKNAIKKLGVGNINKLAMRFEKTFWPSDRDFIGYMSRRKGEFPLFLDWAHASGKPYLVSILGNEFSKSIEKQEDIEVTVMVHQVLYKLFEDAGMPISMRFSRWSSEKFSKGAFSYLPAGVEIVNRDYLALPEKRIFFAGEATIRDGAGTAHGAYNSGLRAANWIMEK